LIDAGPENIQAMQISGDITEVIFSQHYNSGTCASDAQEEFRLRKRANGWKLHE